MSQFLCFTVLWQYIVAVASCKYAYTWRCSWVLELCYSRYIRIAHSLCHLLSIFVFFVVVVVVNMYHIASTVDWCRCTLPPPRERKNYTQYLRLEKKPFFYMHTHTARSLIPSLCFSPLSLSHTIVFFFFRSHFFYFHFTSYVGVVISESGRSKEVWINFKRMKHHSCMTWHWSPYNLCTFDKVEKKANKQQKSEFDVLPCVML